MCSSDLLLTQVPHQTESVISHIAFFRVNGELLLIQGKSAAGLAEMIKASKIEAPGMNRAFLARAYLAASENDSDAAIRSSEREHAMTIYRDIANNPASTWYAMQNLTPGIYADSLDAYLSFTESRKDVPNLQLLYAALRGRDRSTTAQRLAVESQQ